MPLIDYKIHYLERKYDTSSTTEKREFVKEALKVVTTAENESVKEELLRSLRDKTGISYHALERDMQNLSAEEKSDETQEKRDVLQTKITETASSADKQIKALRFILAAKLFSAPYAKELDLSTLPVRNETHKQIAEYIRERETAGERIRPSELFELLDEDSAELNAILDLNYDDKLTGSVAERFFKDSIRTLQNEQIEREIAYYNNLYSTETDTEKKKEYAQKIVDCVNRKSKLKKNK